MSISLKRKEIFQKEKRHSWDVGRTLEEFAVNHSRGLSAYNP